MSSFIAKQQQAARKTKLANNPQNADKKNVEAVPSCLSLYAQPPKAVLCIEDFERYAIDRLRGLLIIWKLCK